MRKSKFAMNSQITRRAALAVAAPFLNLRAQNRKDRMNILWLLGDDLGTELGCYGHKLVHTPNADRIAAEGVRFTNFHTTAPVCSAARSAWNTGVYQTSIGAHNHRSHRTDGYRLPEGVRLVSHRLRDAGYFTANVTDIAPGVRGSGKTDFNFNIEKPFDGTHWNQRAAGQPFYAQINFTAPHKGPQWVAARKQKNLVDPAKVELPPYYPDHPVVRDEVANYYDAVNLWDTQVGGVMDALKKDGLLENTAIFVFGDNGRCLLRGKQWLYDPGTRTPLLVRWPGMAKPGSVRTDHALSIDITTTAMDIAGVEKPKFLHGQSLFGNAKPRTHIITARDRCDMTVERIRAVRDGKFKFIRNFTPERAYTQHNDYITNSYPTQRIIKELGPAGKLNAVQAQWLAPHKPEMELYDLTADPHEVNNIAAAPAQKANVKKYAAIIDKWVVDTNDHGRAEESSATIAAEEPRSKK